MDHSRLHPASVTELSTGHGRLRLADVEAEERLVEVPSSSVSPRRCSTCTRCTATTSDAQDVLICRSTSCCARPQPLVPPTLGGGQTWPRALQALIDGENTDR